MAIYLLEYMRFELIFGVTLLNCNLKNELSGYHTTI